VNRSPVQLRRDARGLDDPSDLIRCQDYTHRNSTGGTGTHSAGKPTKTEISGKEDKRVREKKEDKPLLFSFSQISVLLLVVNLFYLFTSN
jgi:hypothetical protein